MKKKDKAVPIKWNIPNMLGRYATQITVVPMGDDETIKILFFESKPEIALAEKVKNPIEIRADCVASIIINKSKISRFIEMLNTFI